MKDDSDQVAPPSGESAATTVSTPGGGPGDDGMAAVGTASDGSNLFSSTEPAEDASGDDDAVGGGVALDEALTTRAVTAVDVSFDEAAASGAASSSEPRAARSDSARSDSARSDSARSDVPQDDPLLGTIVDGRYRITNILGRGGMGVVYRVEHDRLHGRPYALKALSALTTEPTELARFHREVRFVSKLRCPYTVQVSDSGALPDGRPYILMEYLEGQTLDVLLAREPKFEPTRALRFAHGVLAALAEAHANDIVHRDLKPANVFVIETPVAGEQLKVLDFGIAKDVKAGATDLTTMNSIVGTPKYMAPEQFQKKPTSNRTDLYSLGLLLYRMLRGRLPFLPDDENIPDDLAEFPAEFRLGWLHVRRAPKRIDDVSPELWAVVETLLAKDPEDRFADADAVIAALETVPENAPNLAARTRGRPTLDARPPEEVADRSNPSSSTQFPVVGETGISTELGPPSRRRSNPRLAAAIIAAAVGVGAWYVMGPTPAPPLLEPVTVRIVDNCTDDLSTSPEGAEVWRGKQMLGTTPIGIERPCHESWFVRFELEGHRPATLELSGRRQNPYRAVRMRALPSAADPSVVGSGDGALAAPDGGAIPNNGGVPAETLRTKSGKRGGGK